MACSCKPHFLYFLPGKLSSWELVPEWICWGDGCERVLRGQRGVSPTRSLWETLSHTLSYPRGT